jgi:hypothetical protein
MSWWKRFWSQPPAGAERGRLDDVVLTMPGWIESDSRPDMRVWRNDQGDALSIAALGGGDHLPSFGDTTGVQRWCRILAESRRAGLIEARVDSSPIGPLLRTISKRLNKPAYTYTGMLFVRDADGCRVWTISAMEQGTTGVREAIVTARLLQEGSLTIETYTHSWAQDPYDPEYDGVDSSNLRFVSDAEGYDEQFPDHPLSRVRRVLATLPAAVHGTGLDPAGATGH